MTKNDKPWKERDTDARLPFVKAVPPPLKLGPVLLPHVPV